jgi:hypothetical protein
MSETDFKPERHRRRRILTAVGGGAAAAVLIAGGTVAAFTVAGAQTPSPAEKAPAPSDKPWPRDGMGERRLGPGKGHGFGFMRGPGGPAIHGEFTTKKPDGGYQVLATQLGEVTEVSSSSLTLKSDDGFTRTYTVDAQTRVKPGNISGIEKGETVHVVAVVDGNKARAVGVVDVAALKDLKGPMREKLRMEKGARPAV